MLQLTEPVWRSSSPHSISRCGIILARDGSTLAIADALRKDVCSVGDARADPLPFCAARGLDAARGVDPVAPPAPPIDLAAAAAAADDTVFIRMEGRAPANAKPEAVASLGLFLKQDQVIYGRYTYVHATRPNVMMWGLLNGDWCIGLKRELGTGRCFAVTNDKDAALPHDVRGTWKVLDNGAGWVNNVALKVSRWEDFAEGVPPASRAQAVPRNVDLNVSRQPRAAALSAPRPAVAPAVAAAPVAAPPPTAATPVTTAPVAAEARVLPLRDRVPPRRGRGRS